MKVKNLAFADQNWGSLAKIVEKDVPFEMTLHLIKMVKKLKDGLEIYGEAKKKLITKYGKEDKKTGNLSVNPKDKKEWAAFIKEMTKLNEIEENYDIEKLVIDKKMEDEMIHGGVKMAAKDFLILGELGLIEVK
jgi:hypothetical protein